MLTKHQDRHIIYLQKEKQLGIHQVEETKGKINLKKIKDPKNLKKTFLKKIG